MAGGVQTLIQKYGVPALIGLALTGGAAFVQSQKDAAVRKALTKTYTDSISAARTADSSAAVQRESTYTVNLAASAKSRHSVLQHAAVAESTTVVLQASLDSAKTAGDSVPVLLGIIHQDSSTIADLHRAIATFEADSIVRDKREQDLHSQLADANRTIGTLITRVNADAKSGFFESTPVKLGELVLATYGGVKLAQGVHLLK